MSDLTLVQLKAQVHATLGTESVADIKERYPSWVADLKLNTKTGWATLLTRLQEGGEDQDEVTAIALLPEQSPLDTLLDELASDFDDDDDDFSDLSLEELFACADEIASRHEEVAMPLAIAIVAEEESPLEPADLAPAWWFVAWVWVQAFLSVFWSDFVQPGLQAATRVTVLALQSAFWFALRRGLPWLREQLAESWYRLRLVAWLYQNRDRLLGAILH